MKNTLKYSLLLVFAAISFVTVNAQKIGYTSMTQIAYSLPEVQTAFANLESIRKRSEQQLASKVEVIQSKIAETQKNANNLTPAQIQTIEQDLQQKREELLKDQQNLSSDFEKQQQDILKPIEDKINAAIKAVAIAENYDYIVETDTQTLVYAAPEDDITKKVVEKLK